MDLNQSAEESINLLLLTLQQKKVQTTKLCALLNQQRISGSSLCGRPATLTRERDCRTHITKSASSPSVCSTFVGLKPTMTSAVWSAFLIMLFSVGRLRLT
ncbi:hypothetical protein L596_001452 [Steinernema carpocapsae]|uniref:Uncharacterized protein n=1 Tax=Steinernema carpocapsae TaxID=34508 RepID=A0A4V6I7E2_STECR|nr:hypothetical protein L596_001452 [Steinernema carpocapsae]